MLRHSYRVNVTANPTLHDQIVSYLLNCCGHHLEKKFHHSTEF